MIKVVFIFIIFFIEGCNKEPVIDKNINKNINIKDKKQNSVFDLEKQFENIYFYDNQFNINLKNYSLVIKNAKIIEKIILNYKKKIYIISYTNHNIIDEYSFGIAIKRGSAIKKILLSYGIPKDKIFIRALASLSKDCKKNQYNSCSKIEFKIFNSLMLQ